MEKTGVDGRPVKVTFELTQDEGGWPPVGGERLWAELVTADTVRLRNTPWFARNAANGDLVRVSSDGEGHLTAVERLEWAGNCTVRVVVFRGGPLAGSLPRALAEFAPLGVGGEAIHQYGMLALDVPPDVDLPAVKGLLVRGEREGWWDYEEGCVGDAWHAAEAAMGAALQSGSC